MRVIVIGGGWAGCSAAYFARQVGAEVSLIERTDLLLGTGLVGGIMRNNGRLTATLEAKALGAAEFFTVIEKVTRHRNLDFPGHQHADLYDVQRIEPAMRKELEQLGVNVVLRTLINTVHVERDTISSVADEAGNVFSGDVFIDTTGTAGPMRNCIRYGTGCAMCILRCPSFGPRISVTERAGVKELKAGDGLPQFEAMSGSCKLSKPSLKRTIVRELNEKGVLIIPLPKECYKYEALRRKACQQYALEEYATNLIILDTGHAKLMTPYFPLELLRSIDGFKEAKYADPYSGGVGNSVRFMAMAPCHPWLQVKGINNLFCAGEKAGLLVGHTEAIVTGMLAGHNAVRLSLGSAPVILPDTLAIGDILSYMLSEMKKPEGMLNKYTFSGSVYFERMKEKGLYIVEQQKIEAKVKILGLAGIFAQKLLP